MNDRKIDINRIRGSYKLFHDDFVTVTSFDNISDNEFVFKIDEFDYVTTLMYACEHLLFCMDSGAINYSKTEHVHALPENIMKRLNKCIQRHNAHKDSMNDPTYNFTAYIMDIYMYDEYDD